MRLARWLLAGAACALVLTPRAVAAPGDKLTQLSPSVGCVAATDLGVGCALGRSLDLPAGLTLSPAGEHLYAPTFISQAITVFSRNADSGRITQLAGAAGCVDQVGNGVTCADGRGLRGAGWAEVSADGAYVYVAARFSKAIAIFSRNSATGALTQVPGTAGCIADLSTSGSEGCTTAPLPLGGVNAVALSPDGRQLYAGSFDGDQMSVFARNTSTGALTMVSCINATGSGGCDSGRLMGRIFAVLASADGKNVYATAWGSDAIDVFARDATTGALTQLPGTAGCIAESGDGVTCADGVGLDAAHDIRLSSDGRTAYVASNESDAVTIWDRDTSTGALTANGCISRPGGACATAAAGLDGVQALALSPGGESLYGASVADDAVAAFGRDGTTGALTQAASTAACISESGSGGTCEDGVGLDSAASVLVAPDGRFAYAAGAASDAITVYERGARPVASFTASPDPADVDEPVTFDASASSDADGTIVRYEWDLDGNGSFETDGGANSTTTRAYATAGSLTIGLRVTDDDGKTTVATRTLEVTAPPDTTPPAAPTGVAASAGDGQVSLDWSDNTEPDLDGYDVYRAEQSGGPYTKINTARLTTSTYTDTGLTNATTYHYVVRAVDTAGNQSADSTETSATPQASPPSAYRAAVLGTPGLVSYWRLGESSGAVAADERTVNPGAYLGAPALGATGALTGDPNTAAAFDGVNDELSVSGSGLALAANGSLEGWFDTASATTIRDHTSGGGWILSFSNSGNLAYRVGGTTYTTTRPVSSLPGWHHYVATKAGSNAALYVDGELVHSATNAGTKAAILPWHVMRNGNRAEYTTGRADEIAIYNQPLDATTIAAHHQAGTAG